MRNGLTIYAEELNDWTDARPRQGRSSLSRNIVMIWLLGVFALSPIRLFTLPLNLEVVDFWVLMGLPLMWLMVVLRPDTRLVIPYTVITLIILLGSLVSVFEAPNPSRGLIVIAKEFYLLLLLITFTSLFCKLDEKDLRRVLYVWVFAIVGHGLLMIAQFAVPEIWRMTAGVVGKAASFTVYRPSGLFMSEEAGDANKAAVFQLLGFAPLLVAGFSRRTTIILAFILLCSILVTGSMGTTSSLTMGLILTFVLLTLIGKSAVFFNMQFIKLVLGIFFLLTVVAVVVSQNEDYMTRIEGVLVGRSERSAEGRFDLWSRGKEVFLDRATFLWGVGPGNFRDVDGKDKQLHNDLLAFTVERGMLTALFLVAFGLVAVWRCLLLLKVHRRHPDVIGVRVVVFFTCFVAMGAISLTHQIFHTRELWILFALQEALLYNANMKVSKKSILSEGTNNYKPVVQNPVRNVVPVS